MEYLTSLSKQGRQNELSPETILNLKFHLFGLLGLSGKFSVYDLCEKTKNNQFLYLNKCHGSTPSLPINVEIIKV